MVVFFFQAEDGIRDYKVTGVQTCALPISFMDGIDFMRQVRARKRNPPPIIAVTGDVRAAAIAVGSAAQSLGDRKSTRLNSSHLVISYAVFCLKKKKKN